MPTILIIDDDPHMGVILTRILMRHGFQVLFAQNGASGIEQVETNRPDLVLLDIVMPGMDGVEVARRLRAEPRFAGMPIVFLTAFWPAVGRHEAEAVNVDGFISKPFDIDDLVAQVKALTGLTDEEELD